MAAATCPRPLGRRTPPRPPRRQGGRAGGEVGAASPNDPGGISSRLPSGSSNNQQEEERQHELGGEEEEGSRLDLARLMLSPGGLPMKKITLEGFKIPVVLRLLDRQSLRRLPEDASEAAAAGVALSVTWVDQDGFGFDVLGLTVRRGGEEEEEEEKQGDGGDDDAESGGGGGSERWKGGAARATHWGRGYGVGGWRQPALQEEEEERMLALSWRMGGGAADVVLEAASRQQRDLVAATLETVVAGLRAAGSSASGEGTAFAGAAAAGIGHVRRAESCSSAELLPRVSSIEFNHVSAAGVAVGDDDGPCDSDGEEEATPEAEPAAWMLGEFEKAAAADTDGCSSRRTTLAGLESAGPQLSATHPPAAAAAAARSKPCSGSGSNGNAASDGRGAVAAAPRGSSAARRRHRRGVSFGPGSGVPALTRARTTGAVADGESEAERRHRREQHARRREDAMVRLLAVYDRARDESRAAALRLGVRNYTKGPFLPVLLSRD